MEYPHRFKDCAAELGKFLEVVSLPEGLRFKDWGNGAGEYRVITADTPRSDSECYLETQMIGIERISDGKTVTIEVCGLKDGAKVTRMIVLNQMVHTIDKAIANLS